MNLRMPMTPANDAADLQPDAQDWVAEAVQLARTFSCIPRAIVAHSGEMIRILLD